MLKRSSSTVDVELHLASERLVFSLDRFSIGQTNKKRALKAAIRLNDELPENLSALYGYYSELCPRLRGEVGGNVNDGFERAFGEDHILAGTGVKSHDEGVGKYLAGEVDHVRRQRLCDLIGEHGQEA